MWPEAAICLGFHLQRGHLKRNILTAKGERTATVTCMNISKKHSKNLCYKDSVVRGCVFTWPSVGLEYSQGQMEDTTA